jgi:hypothetical protein
MKIDTQIADTIGQLKDFQLKTVEYAIDRFSKDQNRILIADEVGLGKTIVAKGIVAKLYEKAFKKGKHFSVVYICSNKALAKQNLSKLSVIKKLDDNDTDADEIIDYSEEDDRISALAYEPKKPNKYRLNIKALTPATSFDKKTSAGKYDERLLLYRLLSSLAEFKSRRVALKWFLCGGKTPRKWMDAIDCVENIQTNPRKIRDGINKQFLDQIHKPLPYLKYNKIYKSLNITQETSLLFVLQQLLGERKKNKSFIIDNGITIFKTENLIYQKYNTALISELRFRLALVSKEYLKADLFILDEFQRFSNLIQTDAETDDPGTFLAKSIFSKHNVKVLMLSATPFKTYTNTFDELQGENHFKEFNTVLRFLMQDKSETFWAELEEENSAFFKLIRSFNSSEESFLALETVKRKVEEKYRGCIARTERNLVETPTEDTIDGSIIVMRINKEDIIDFQVADLMVKVLNDHGEKTLPIPVEYVKSSPFPFSFLQDYEHMKVLEAQYLKNNEVKKVIKNAKRAWVPEERIMAYKALLPESTTLKDQEPNAKLRMLYDETVRNKGWQLLWVPPSISYYNVTKGAFVDASDFTKTLIFSSWKMVPRMVSAMVSYEAERLSVGKLLERKKDNAQYRNKDERRYPSPLLTFKNIDGAPSGMNNFMLAYPSEYLARIYDPASNLYDRKTLHEIRSHIFKIIESHLVELDILSRGSVGGDVQKWDWYALFLLDKHEQSQKVVLWAKSYYDHTLNHFDNEDEKKANDSTGKQKHLEEIKKCLTSDNYTPNIGRLTRESLKNLCWHLVNLCLGSPAVCSLRSFTHTYPAYNDKIEHFTSAYHIGLGFISLFNKPESIAIIEEFENEKFYHKNVVQYAIHGNIQSMLDEFIYQLKDSSGLSDPLKCAEFIRDILTVNSSRVDIKTVASLNKNAAEHIRTHYALPFGLGSSSDLKNGLRQIKVREAFNSPFRPFVLTSTSIGQEGLDFHYYCSKLIHWNLPSNPIDLEQREGRIKRFKGLSIRRKIAQQYKQHLVTPEEKENVWQQLFLKAQQNKPTNQCDLVPFWHLDGSEDANIQSLIPIYQFSKDYDKLKNIKTVLGNYRLTFGQPRQEELIYILDEVEKTLENKKKLKDLAINLCPITYFKTPAES